MFQYYVTLENGDNLVAKEVDQPKASISGKFTAHNLILVTFISTLLVTKYIIAKIISMKLVVLDRNVAEIT